MAKRPLERQVQRILAIVPHLVANPGAQRADVAAQFGISVDQLDDDLDLMLMIGVPPYSPGDYVDVWEDADGGITLRMAESFRRPVRLTAAEGLALLTAGKTLLSVPGADPSGLLARALDKLAAVLDMPDVIVDVAAPPHLAAVKHAVESREQLEITYWSASRGEESGRVVDPLTVFFALGAWYTGAYCHRAQGDRLFRVDRIRALRTTGETFDGAGSDFEPTGRASGGPPPVFNPSPDDVRVRLRVARRAAWVAEVYPVENVVTPARGRLKVTLAVAQPAWLERLLLQLGPDAVVEAPAEYVDLGREAAARVLARYDATVSESDR